MDNQRLAQLATRLREIMDRKDAIKAEETALNKEWEEIRKFKLPKAMEDAEVEKFTVPEVGTVSVKQDFFCSLAAGDGADEPPFYDWARSNAPDLIRPYIQPARLKAWAKERLENGEAIPDNSLKASFVPTAVLRRA